jgi:hypothetical protein
MAAVMRVRLTDYGQMASVRTLWSASASPSRADTRRSALLGSKGAATTARSALWSLLALGCAPATDTFLSTAKASRAPHSATLEPAGELVLKGLHRAAPVFRLRAIS